MPSVVHVQAIMPALTGMAEDAAINTFTFASALAAGDAAAAIGTYLAAFYNDDPGTDPIAAHIARSRDRSTGACTFKYFDITAHLNGTPAGPPILIESWTLGTYSTSNSLPEEVALAISFHGTLTGLSEFVGGTRPRARHRGRVYIGPLTDNVSDTLTPEYVCRPKSNIVADWAASAEQLMTDVAAGTGGEVGWHVWSRANAATYQIVGGWVDNSFDTIRGRGVDPTFKETWGSLV